MNKVEPSFTSLRIGSRGSRVKEIQKYLNVDQDGIFGPITEGAVENFQASNNLSITGQVDEETFNLLKNNAQYIGMISPNALKLILDFEVGGGKNHYNKYLAVPTWPGGDSGVTIGIGYDLGYNDLAPWIPHLSAITLGRLSEAINKKGQNARRLVSKFSNIRIPWGTAMEVFEGHTLPKQVRLTRETFPGMEELPMDVQGVLVSLVYNRGTSMRGDSRREMREIRKCVADKNLEGIAAAIERSKRLWVGKGLAGLLARRDAEADLVRKSIA